jgi:chorismate synthase
MSIRFLTAGESHGRALVGILEGMPAGLTISLERIQKEMKRRKLGVGRSFRQKIEDDSVEILSGIRHGQSLGSPIAIMIQNRDWESWKDVMQVEAPKDLKASNRRKVTVPRPGHADYVGGVKYGHEDLRNVLERASARETAARVAIGSLARIFLEEFGIQIASRVTQIGKVKDEMPFESLHFTNEQIDASPVRCLSKNVEDGMIAEIEKAGSEGDTVGGAFEVIVNGLPIGLGSYVHWDKRLEGKLAHSLMSLNAIKAVEMGIGVEAASLRGSQVHDEFVPVDNAIQPKSNRSGGIDGGMSTGQPLVVRAYMKPLSTLMKPLESVDLATGESANAHIERSDVCGVPSAAVIGESLVALDLMSVFLDKFGGDSVAEIKSRL